MLIINDLTLTAIPAPFLQRLIDEGLSLVREKPLIEVARAVAYEVVPNRFADDRPPAFEFQASPGDRYTAWDTHTFNCWNRAAYRLPEQHAWMRSQQHLLSSPLFAEALAGLLAEHVRERGSSDRIRVADICGGFSAPFWALVSDALGERPLEVTILDAAVGEDRVAVTKRLTIISKPIDLSKHAPALPQLVDAATCLYGLDSIWFPGEQTVVHHRDSWWSPQFRLRVPAWHPRQDQVFHNLCIDGPLALEDLALVGTEWSWQQAEPPAQAQGDTMLPEIITTPTETASTIEHLLTSLVKPGGPLVIGDVSLGTTSPSLEIGVWGYGRYHLLSHHLLPAVLSQKGCSGSRTPLGAFVGTYCQIAPPSPAELMMAPQLIPLWSDDLNHESVLIVTRPAN